MIGTIFNTLTVLVGSSVGLVIKRKVKTEFVFDVVGLFTFYLGVDMSLKTANPVGLILGLLIGTALGERVKLNDMLRNLAERLKGRVGGDSLFVDGMITAFITFCVGPMTVVGALKDGMGDPSIIMAKAVMDGFTSAAYASAMGLGVLFSAIPLLVFQGSLALAGSFLGSSMPTNVIRDLTGAGGVILLGLAVDLLRIRDVKVANMLPSLVMVPLISALFLSLLPH